MRSVNRIFIILLTVLTYCSAAVAQSSGDVIIRYVDAQKGSYANPGTSWATATKSLQGAINELYAILQKDPTKTGRVYVMGQYLDSYDDPVPGSGTYTPTESVEQVSTGVLDTSFKLYAGISIYGSFSPESIKNNTFQEDGTLVVPAGSFSPESDEYLKELRPMRPSPSSSPNYQWNFTSPSTLSGNHAANADEDPLVWNENNDQYDQSFPGNSYHVLWFATNGYIDNAKHPNRARGLDRESVVDGFVIRDGNALNKSNTDHKHNSYGGGAYMVHNAVVRRCVFTQNAASLRGGAVYMDGGGLVEQCYFNRNQAAGVGITDGYGGAVCIDGDGAVKHSVMDNNAARVGGGLMIGSYDSDSYPAKDNTYDDAGNVTASADTRVSKLNYYHPYAAGCIINNNTTTAEGGGVMLKGGTLNHCTITNNNCVGVDVTYNGRRYGRSGGLYVDGGGLAVNTVCWGNQVKNNKDVQYAAYTINSTDTQKPILAYCAFSNTALTDWSGTSKRSVLTLNDANEPSATSTDNEYFPCFNDPSAKKGVIKAANDPQDPFMPIEQDWKPEGYSYLRAQGIQLNDYPGNTNIKQAHIAQDMFGRDYTAKTTLGALVTTGKYIEPATDVKRVRIEATGETIDDPILTLFVDPAKGHTVSTMYGNNWDNPLFSINDALTQLAVWQNANGTFTYGNGTASHTYNHAQILVKEGELNCSGGEVYGQLRSSSIDMLTNVRLYGGFPTALTGTETGTRTLVRNPVAHPTRITAEVSADGYQHNACHIINFSNVTNAVVDGFQLYYANAWESSDVFTVRNKNGAGVICGNTNTTAGNEVKMDNRIRNCNIANCTAGQGSAIYVSSRRKDVRLQVENCVIHNNEAKADAGATIYATTDASTPAETTLTINHCTIRGNVGYAIANADEEHVTIDLKNSAIHANAKAELAAITLCKAENVLGIKGSISATSANNMQDGVLPAITGIVSKFTYSSSAADNPNYTYPKFVNPTRNIGVSPEGDLTVYGGSPNWMPGNMNPMVNAASDTGASATDASWGKDMTTVIFRNYGGAADIGALENYDLNNSKYQPAYGKVIYVRDYRDANGNVDTSSKGGDGSSWAKAINGNCTTYTNNHGFKGWDAEPYASGKQLTGLQWAVDEAYYRSLEKDANGGLVAETFTNIEINGTTGQSVQRGKVVDENRVQVWVASGEYIRQEGFFMRDGVDVYGGFPSEGNPGMNERTPKDEKNYTIIETNKTADINNNNYLWGYPSMLSTDDFSIGTAYKTAESIHRNYFHIPREILGDNVVSSEEPDDSGNKSVAENIIDGNKTVSNCWHSKWNGGAATPPHYIIVGSIDENTNLSDATTYVSRQIAQYDFTFIQDEVTKRPDKIRILGSNTPDDDNSWSVIFPYSGVTTTSVGGVEYGVVSTANSLISVQMPLDNLPSYKFYKIELYVRFARLNELEFFSSYLTDNQIPTDTQTDKYKYDINRDYGNAYHTHRVLTQQMPYFDYTSATHGLSRGSCTEMEYQNVDKVGFGYPTIWDGFVIQNGRTRVSHPKDGGAGVALRTNGIIQNCIIRNNINVGERLRGGAIFCNGGQIINCEVFNNSLQGNSNSDCFGGGMYIRTGTCYNTIYAENTVEGSNSPNEGAAVYFESGMFFNNTVSKNNGSYALATVGWFDGCVVGLYNTILYDNFTSNGDIYFMATDAFDVTVDHILLSAENKISAYGDGVKKGVVIIGNPLLNNDYTLQSGSPAINKGTDAFMGSYVNNVWKPATDDNGNIKYLDLPSFDAAYNARIQDCTVDIGAYEYNGAYDITPDLKSVPGQAIYYVTQNGRGNASASSPENAACATKLQKVLDAAGRYIKDHSTNLPDKIIVKLAGDYDKTGFVYTPLNSAVDADANATGEEVASTYSIMVPRGVELWGGYTDDYTSPDNNGFYTKTTDDKGNPVYTDNRDVMTHHTVLSGEFVKDELTVNAYHVVTFTDRVYNGEHKPMTVTEGGTDYLSLADYAGSMKAVVDGVFIQGGMAVGESNSATKNIDRYGGAAVVTDYAHVRNCIIRDNSALNGGGALCLQPGALVSGCLIELNAATGNDGKGGGIYVQPHASTSNGTTSFDINKARVLTSTIVNNWAQNDGGGIYFGNDDPNLRANSVVLWQNDSNGELNVSGLLDPFSQTDVTGAVEDYPLSYCAVELLRVPGINNIDVSNIMNQGVRFEDYTKDAAYNNDQWTYTDPLGYYYLSDYSTLARAGMSYGEYTAMQGTFPSLETKDFAGICRMEEENGVDTKTKEGDILNKDNEYIEIGARAYNGSLKLEVKDKLIMHRIYVSKQEVDMDYITKLKTLTDNVYALQGSSQAYPMHRLDDALEYVREVRKKTKTVNSVTSYTHNNEYFEIFLTKGEYTPLRTAAGQKTNSRGNTFLVPEGVAIYGGLDTESDVKKGAFYGQIEDKSTETNDDIPATKDSNGDPTGMPTIETTATTAILEARQHYDMNKNSIIEPWEFKNQSQLSGNVVNNNVKQNVFHVVTILADEKYVGGLPTKKADGTTALDSNADAIADAYDKLLEAEKVKTYREKGAKVVIDGVEIRDGRALGYEEAAEDTRTFYRGGGILVFGNWTTGHQFKHVSEANPRAVGYRNIPLEVRNCQFVDNGARLGGAIYSDSEVSIVQSSFVQNFAEGKTETFTDNTDPNHPTTISYSGRGGALNLSYEASIVNTIFANNEARRASTDASNEAMGWGGAVSMGDFAALNMLNCDVVKNKAVAYPAVYLFKANQGGDVSSAKEDDTLKANNPTKIVNTVFWGNVTENDKQTAARQMVVNYKEDDPTDTSTDNTDAETLWFCAYEQDKGLTPKVLSTDVVDLRSVEYEKDTYIPYAWNSIPTTEGNTASAITNNIIISSQNEVTGGPNFIKPSTIAGCDGYDVSADWMIGRINNLVDNGWTYLQQNSNKNGYDKVTKTGYTEQVYDGSGIYWTVTYDILGDDLLPIGEDQYMYYANAAEGSSNDDKRIKRISNDPNPTHEQSYIDIGVYEYQHQVLVPAKVGDLDLLWVTDQEQSGVKADGKTFATASSDLQRAIETLLSYRNGHRKEIRLLAGEYQPVYTLNGNLGFTIDTEHVNVSAINGVSDDKYYGVASLTIQGGWSKEVKGQYDVDKYPAYIYSSQRTGVKDENLAHVFVINNAQQIETSTPSVGGKKTHKYTNHVVPITLEGIVFCNVIGKVHNDFTYNTKKCRGGAAVYYKDQYDVELISGEDRTNSNVKMDNANGKAKRSTTKLLKEPVVTDGMKNHCPSNLLGNKLTIRQCGFRFNGMKAKIDDETPLPAVSIGKGGGKTFIYNSVFHTNGGDALVATGTKVVNCTFAQNYGNVKFYDHSNTNPSEMHNSLLWLNHRIIKDADKRSRSSVQWTNESEFPENPENSSTWTTDATMAATANQQYFTYNAATTLPDNDNDYIDGTEDTAYNMYLSKTNDDVISGPNFVNPMDGTNDLLLANLRDLAARDYNLQPGVKTVGKANPYLYINKVYGATTGDHTFTHDGKQETVKVTATGTDTSGRGHNKSVMDYLKYVNVHKDNTEVSGTMEPSDMENATLRADKDDCADKDKGYYDRYYGSRGMELGAYECIASISDVMYYDPHLTAEGNGSSWEHAYPYGQLNKALMAAAVAAAGGNKAYVFAHGTNTNIKTDEYVTMYDRVHLIGGLKQSFKKQHNDWKDAGETTKMYPTTESFVATAIYERQGVAGDEANPTIINGVTLAPNCKQAEIDGVVISNEGVTGDLTSPVVNLSQGSGLVIRNSIIRNNTMGAVDNTAVPLISMPPSTSHALMYNVLVRDNIPGTTTSNSTGTTQAKGLYMVNCTVADGTIQDLEGLDNDHSYNNLFGVASTLYAPYFNTANVPYTLPKNYSKDLWYQLVEGSDNINKGVADFLTATGSVFASGGTFQDVIDYNNDLDLLGNPRKIGAQVDNGCYETWSTSYLDDTNSTSYLDDTNATKVKALAATTDGGVTIDYNAGTYSISTYGGNQYPHPGSVVYLDGGALTLNKKEDSSLSFTSANPMTAGYLLVKNGGSLYGQGNHVSLDYVAVEKSQAQYALVSLPFTFKAETFKAENNDTCFKTITTDNTAFTPVKMGKGFYSYDAKQRAQWGYNFKKKSSDCWKPWKPRDYEVERTANEGFLFDRGAAATTAETLRYTGTGTAVYTEGGEAKKVTLQQYDTRTTADGSAHFTRNEDMGWNLKGLPYLISGYPTNTTTVDGTYQMNVPHVIYDMDAKKGNYGTKQSWTGGPTLTVGDGFFTQTAKIVDEANNGSDFEQLTFNYYDGSSTSGTVNPAPLLEMSDANGYADRLEVRAQEQGGSLVYCLGSDGVKMVSPMTAMPQVYALGAQGVGMSLLANAPAATDIALGVRTMQRGAYTFALPATLPFDAFGHVWLMDKEARQVTDLMTGSYTASIEGDGYNEQRFVLRIGGMMPDLDGCSSSSANSYLISVRGTTVTVANLQGGEHIYVYTPVGALVSHTVAEQEQHQMSLPQGVYVVKVNGMAKKVNCY